MTRGPGVGRARHGLVAFAWIAPELDGPPTGGTLFNAHVMAALAELGIDCARYGLADAKAALASGAARMYLLDSLYLSALPELARAPHAGRLHLLLHYLPSLVRLGRLPERDELAPDERAALALAEGFVVTSPYLARALEGLGAAARPLCVVEPGAELSPHSVERAESPLHAVMLASVVAGKGLLPLLERLAARLRSDDAWTLSVAGSLELEPDYARGCRTLIACTPALAARVHLLGALSHARALELLGSADVLLSASSMEAYGMALAEARAAGVPIVARCGGHVIAHVEPAAGGVLVDDAQGVADVLLAFARDRDRFARHRALARSSARSRSWRTAAFELARLVEPNGPAALR